MVKIERAVKISDKLSLLFDGKVVCFMSDTTAQIDFFSKEFNLLNIQGYDLFDCLFKLREFLENKKLFILCQGSARNVYPSGMARSMSSGLKAYLLKLGKKPSREDIVDIFDAALAEDVGLISEQNDFFEKWIQTLKQP